MRSALTKIHGFPGCSPATFVPHKKKSNSQTIFLLANFAPELFVVLFPVLSTGSSISFASHFVEPGVRFGKMYSSTSTTSTAASTPTRRQSHLSLPPLLPDELTPLHSSSSSTTTTRGTGTWSPSALRRKSAFISDLISHHSHSTESHPVAGGSKGIGYDGEFQRELEGEGGNGVRDWYSTYTTIDWMHDAVKDSVRLRRLRRRRGSVAGFVKNLLDALEGWIIVTMVGFVSALVAYLVITSEMLLFDLKSGYCTNSYWQPRRFCCQTVANRSALFIGRAMIEKGHGGEEECAAWRSWSQVYYNLPSSSATSHEPSHWIDYGVFIVIAVSSFLYPSPLS